MKPKHEHPVLLVGHLLAEDGAGTYPLWWCRVCGTLLEQLDIGAAEIIPEMATAAGVEQGAALRPEGRLEPRHVVAGATMRIGGRRLGRGLVALRAAGAGVPTAGLEEAFGLRRPKP